MKKNIKYLNVLLIVVIAVGLVFIIVRLATLLSTQNQAANDAQASGFGANATKDLFEPAAQLFANTDCADVFDNQVMTSDKFPELAAQNLTLESIRNLDLQNYQPLSCEYKFNNGKSLTFTIYSYDENSPIDNSQADLFGRVNEYTIEQTIDSDVMGIMTYFFGTDIDNNSNCRTNIYHPVNDFEYATIVYTGFDCSSIYNLNREITSVFNRHLYNAMDFVYVTFEDKTTAEMLDQWGFSDLKKNLSFYE